MTLMIQTAAEAVRSALLAVAGDADQEIEVGRLISTVAQQVDQDVELVTAAMWDLVDEGALDYGTDARVRPGTRPAGA